MTHSCERVNDIQKPEVCLSQIYKVINAHLKLFLSSSSHSPYFLSSIVQAPGTYFPPVVSIGTSPYPLLLLILFTLNRNSCISFEMPSLPFPFINYAYTALITRHYVKLHKVRNTCPLSIVVVVAKYRK